MTTDSNDLSTEHRFQAEVDQVLGIVINSLYSHREVFLRELVSNASDALDKLRFLSVTQPEMLGDEADLAIRISSNRAKRELVIADNGVGMTKDELMLNLGTIARSGSRRFVEALREKQGAAAPDLIGQFGVGFYSAFLVADRVTVTTRAAGSDEAWTWTSEAKGTFRIDSAPTATRRGTEIRLHLKEDADEFAEEARIRHLVQRYSDFVGHPILFLTGAGAEQAWRTINEGAALWRRPKADIDDDAYDAFYCHVSHDWEKPALRAHFSIEGTREFTALRYVPSRRPPSLFDPERRHGVRLYVKRVFIMEDCEELLPSWLRFVRGVVDADDLPLNVSRELLQEDKAVRAIRKQVTRKMLDLLEETSTSQPEKFAKVWDEFGVPLKEGICQDEDHRERLTKLALFASSAEERTTLSGYVSRMKDGQEAIYYLFAPSRNAAEGSPQAEALVGRGFEVLWLTDVVDEFAMHAIDEFEGKPLRSAASAALEVPEEEGSAEEKDRRSAADEAASPLVAEFERILGDQIDSVRLSRRMTESPACLVVPEGGIHPHLERLLRERDQGMPPRKRILELQPDHPVIARLAAMHATGKDADMAEWAYMLLDGALLAEGSPIADPPSYARRVARLMAKVLSGDD